MPLERTGRVFGGPPMALDSRIVLPKTSCNYTHKPLILELTGSENIIVEKLPLPMWVIHVYSFFFYDCCKKSVMLVCVARWWVSMIAGHQSLCLTRGPIVQIKTLPYRLFLAELRFEHDSGSLRERN